MGASASALPQLALTNEQAELTRLEYEKKKAENLSDDDLFLHMKAYVESICSQTEQSKELPDDIKNQMNSRLALAGECHPIGKMMLECKTACRTKMETLGWQNVFEPADMGDPIVSTAQNFDSLLIGQNHTARRESDTYYISKTSLLRTQMLAHLKETIEKGDCSCGILAGDTYRRLEEDDTTGEMRFEVTFYKVDNFKQFMLLL